MSDIRFADLKPNQQSQADRIVSSPWGGFLFQVIPRLIENIFSNKDGAPDKNSGATTQDPVSFSGTIPQHGEAKAYDRLAADKPGEELTPEATIWKLYVAEAEEADRELVEREHRNIDVMLVFVRISFIC